MEQDILDVNEQQTKSFTYESFGNRFVAFIIDGAIITVIGYLIWGERVVQSSGGSYSVNFEGETTILPFLYLIISWVLLSSTIGKLVLGQKIVDKDGKRINPLQAGIRFASYLLILIGCWFILGSQKKQALHDLLAGTYVIKK